MISSDQRPPGEDWLVRRIVDLERQVRELQAGRRLEAATIGAGGITIRGGAVRVLDEAGHELLRLGKAVDGRYGLLVNDAEGNPQVRAGELAGGGYGLEAVDSAGKLVSLLTLAFGMTADEVLTFESTSSTSFVDLTTVGPSVSVDIGDSGRALVLFNSEISWIDNTTNPNAGGQCAVDVSGATTRPASNGQRTTATFSLTGPTFGAGEFQFAGMKFFDDLNAGVNTFKLMYRSVSAGKSCDFQVRTIAVLPY